ncbi:MAG: hypothetical protein WBW81_12030 [Methylocella sp.]
MSSEEPEIRKVDEGANKQRETSKSKGLSLPSLRKFGEFLANVLTLERSVDALKAGQRVSKTRCNVSNGKSMGRPVN